MATDPGDHGGETATYDTEPPTLTPVSRPPTVLEDCLRAIASLDSRKLEPLAGFIRTLARRRATLHVLANGGLATVASHFAIEALTPSAPPLPRIVAPTVDGALLSMLTNDYCAQEALGRYIDKVLIPTDGTLVLSHSGGRGKSYALVEAARASVARGIETFAITGDASNPLAGAANNVIEISVSRGSPSFEVATLALLQAVLEALS